MIDQAARYGLNLEIGEVVGVDSFSSCTSVVCADGGGYTCNVVIVAGGCLPKRLGVPGEETFVGHGVIHCALCDGSQFAHAVVAVCGGGDAGVTEALYLAKLASKVILIEAEPALTASAVLRQRALAHPRLETRCGERVVAMIGDERLRGVDVRDSASGRTERLAVDGVLVHVGVEPNTGYLKGVLALDEEGQIPVNMRLQTDIRSIFAAGDIRADSPRQVAAAVGDGAVAAVVWINVDLPDYCKQIGKGWRRQTHLTGPYLASVARPGRSSGLQE